MVASSFSYEIALLLKDTYKLSNFILKTRRGNPVDDRPSTYKLHHFVQKKNLKKINEKKIKIK